MKKILFIGLGTLVLAVSAVFFWVMHVLSDLPDVSSLKRYRPPAAAEVLDKDGNLLTHYYDGKFRLWVPIANVPSILIQAVVTAEDDTFFAHKGVNYKATWDALLHDVEKRRFARGGSTITQQMIKNVLLSKEKTISRKIREYVLATKAEKVLTKRQILEIYLNEVEWGENIYGVEAASRFYFDKHVGEITSAEAALLAGMLPNPRYFNPYKRSEKARDRQERVLFNMQQAKILTQEQYTAAMAEPLTLRREGASRFSIPTLGYGGGRPCYERALEQALLTVFGDHVVYRSGKTVRTTLDKALQAELNREKDVKGNGMPEEVLVVRQNGFIRAFVCGLEKEQEVRDAATSHWFTFPGYEVGRIDLSSVERDEIVPSDQEKSK